MKMQRWWPLALLAGAVLAEGAARLWTRPWPTVDDFALRPETASGKPRYDCALRVLVLGDSVVYGRGVSYGQSYPAPLERGWSAAHASNPVSVINGGIEGATVLQGVQLWPILDWQYHPHVVLIAFGLNDCNLSRSALDERREHEFMVPAWVDILRRSRLFTGLERRWRRAVGSRTDSQENRVEPRVSAAAFLRALETLVAQIRSVHAIPVLLTAPQPGPGFRPELDAATRERLRASCDRYDDLVRQVADGKSVYLVDIAEGLERQPEDIADDGVHPTAAGYERLTAYIMSALEPVLE
jgi:lysophospholipase L1-like esterase